MEEYLKKIPLASRNALEALRNKKRQVIVIYLKEEGPKSFIDISKKFKFKKGILSHHLKILVGYRLVYHFYSKKIADDKYSYYEISKLGERILEGLINLLDQPQSHPKHEIEAESADAMIISPPVSIGNKPSLWNVLPEGVFVVAAPIVSDFPDSMPDAFKAPIPTVVTSAQAVPVTGATDYQVEGLEKQNIVIQVKKMRGMV